MKTASAKAKGRRLQNLVRDKIRQLLQPWGIEDDDVKGAPMGQSGVDVLLSPRAKKLLPVAIECKNQARMAIYKLWEQAERNKVSCEPVLVIKANNKPVLAVVELDHYLALQHRKILDDQRE